MTVVKRNLFGPSEPMGSSGDGASQPSQIDPNTGQLNTSYQAPRPSSVLSTDGALNNPVYSCMGDHTGVRDPRQSEQDYRASQNQSAGVYQAGAAGIPDFGSGADHEMVQTTRGSLAADSNYQSTTTVGGAGGSAATFKTYTDGGDDPYGPSGGRPLA
jgi:hypothetical protein